MVNRPSYKNNTLSYAWEFLDNLINFKGQALSRKRSIDYFPKSGKMTQALVIELLGLVGSKDTHLDMDIMMSRCDSWIYMRSDVIIMSF